MIPGLLTRLKQTPQFRSTDRFSGSIVPPTVTAAKLCSPQAPTPEAVSKAEWANWWSSPAARPCHLRRCSPREMILPSCSRSCLSRVLSWCSSAWHGFGSAETTGALPAGTTSRTPCRRAAVVIASIRVAAGSAALAALAACRQPGGQAPGHRGDAACGAIAYA